MNPKLNVIGASRNIPPLTWLEAEQRAVHNAEYCANYNRGFDRLGKKCTGSVTHFIRDLTVGNELWCLIRDAVASARDYTGWRDDVFRPRSLCHELEANTMLDEQFEHVRHSNPQPKRDIFLETFSSIAAQMFREKRVYKRSTDAANFLADTIDWVENGPVQNFVVKALAGLGVEQGASAIVKGVTQASVDRLKSMNALLIRQSITHSMTATSKTALRRLVTQILVQSSLTSLGALSRTGARVTKVSKLSNVIFIAPVLLDIVLSLMDYSEQDRFTSHEHLKAFTEEKLNLHEKSTENANFWGVQPDRTTFDAEAMFDFLQEDLDPVDASIYLRYTTVVRVFVISWYLQQCIPTLK
ncbi:hypothetical protein HDE_00889 [Halotydeus destructor]|nr:hypothetical protein HDE_00889 [Halotydeus destructor]